MSLRDRRCIPCERGVMPLTISAANEFMKEVSGWSLSSDARKISKKYSFRNFAEALAFAVRVGALAEQEGHHPVMIVKWGSVTLELFTNAIGGLSKNDFVLAAKIDALEE